MTDQVDGFDYGGEVAETASNFKNPEEGTRPARLYGLIRVGNFVAEFKGEKKDPAPYAIAILQLLGKADKDDEGNSLFITKEFPLKKGEKSFLHSKFIPAMGGFSRHSGFASMKNQLTTVTIKGGKEFNEDGTPKFVNVSALSPIATDMLEDMEELPKYAPDEGAIGFVTEGQLTKGILEKLNPKLDVANLILQTEEYKAGVHPSQEVLKELYESNTELYSPTSRSKKKTEGEEGKESNTPSGAAIKENLSNESEF
ncbi:hypothetical protein [Marinomonas phage CPP1m]|uniref:Uncharacterized protein n=2 Tax=Murciavirus CPP1m TaxID=2733327 RepID=A0A1W5SC35_9CAUD|nr:hypothetical protein HOR72_gp50 [Marinomonas phage CPP1m]ARB11240.1 hypothetical protein [Marinomonas phage CPP1m]ARB11290.1 hypothetical protein [Marinomonas phage CPG1g]